jgi:hypothetical protein
MNQELREVIVMFSLSYYSKNSCFWKGNAVECSTERGNQVAEINVRKILVDNLLTYEDISSCLLDHLAHSIFILFTFWSTLLQMATTSVHCGHTSSTLLTGAVSVKYKPVGDLGLSRNVSHIWVCSCHMWF